MDERFDLRIRRVTNGFIVDIRDGNIVLVPRQAVFQTAAQIAEALPLLLNDPPMVRESETVS